MENWLYTVPYSGHSKQGLQYLISEVAKTSQDMCTHTDTYLYIQSESINRDIVYPTKPLSDTLMYVMDLAPL